MIIDSYDRIIDPRHFKEQIFNFVFPSYSYKRTKGHFEFRKDPVPGIHKRRGHRGSWFRLPRTFQERKLSCETEIKEYVKPARNAINLPNSWDDIPRERNHCWKAKKIKKQWMKHKK